MIVTYRDNFEYKIKGKVAWTQKMIIWKETNTGDFEHTSPTLTNQETPLKCLTLFFLRSM